MASTPRGIVYPTTASQLVPLESSFAVLAQSVDEAMDAFVLPGSYVGTESERTALDAPDLREGIEWRSTDSDLSWYYNGSQWEPFNVVASLGHDSSATPNQGSITTTAVTVQNLSVSVSLARVSNLRPRLQISTYSSNVADVVAIQLFDGTTNVATWTRAANSSPSIAATSVAQSCETILDNVAAGTHVYTVKVSRVAGSGNVTVAPSESTKNWLTIERVG